MFNVIVDAQFMATGNPLGNSIQGCFQHCSHFLPVLSFELHHHSLNTIREVTEALGRMQ